MTPFAVSTLAAGRVHVWWSGPEDLREWHENLLDTGERERRATLLRQTDRERLSLGCALLRSACGVYLDCDPRDVPLDRRCRDCEKPHGKPRLPRDLGLELSLSHSGERVVAAVARGSPVGVDVEEIAGFVETAALTATMLSPQELRAFQDVPSAQRPAGLLSYWTRKEALLKATGDGLRIAPHRLVVSGPNEEPSLIEWIGGPLGPSEVRLHRLHPGPGYVAHLAVIAQARGPVLELDGSELLAANDR